jgi:hypothetical protein
MSQKQDQLLDKFHEAMLGIYQAARQLKPPYRPSDFLRMVNELGGKGAADRLLAKGEVSSGFAELYTRGVENLKISVEYLVLQSPWRALFDQQQLAIARARLQRVNCDLPPENSELSVRDQPLAEEISQGLHLSEGAVRQITINAYERNATARAVCIAHHGTTCYACGFNFGAAYGQVAEGLIHVHHLRRLSEIREEYEVDPIADLRPVCPNCHAVIHLGGESRSIEEVRQLLAAQKTV